MKRALLTIAAMSLAITFTAAHAEHDDDEIPFGAAVLIIELTDNDIELQLFVDGFDWKRLEVFDPKERTIVDVKSRGRLRRQGGMSELFFASEPTHYLEEEPNFDGTIASFLARFPEGVYEFEGQTTQGPELEGEARLTHVLPALPEILSPVPDGDEAPVVDPANLVISWKPVTTRFIGPGGVDIFEYQVIIDQVAPERVTPWVDGGTRRSLINVPPDVTSITVAPETLAPGEYEFEILAIEISGNSTISVGEFVVE